MASSLLLLLPPKAPVSIQDLMTHLLCTWNYFSETLASSLSFSILVILPPICCPNCSLCMVSSPLSCLLAVCLSASLCPTSVQSWWLTGFYDVLILGVTQPTLCSPALICSTAFSVWLLILWFAFSLINAWTKNSSTWLFVLSFHCTILYSWTTDPTHGLLTHTYHLVSHLIFGVFYWFSSNHYLCPTTMLGFLQT